MVGKMTRPLEKKHILCAIKSMAVNPEKIFWINVRGHLLICLFFPATVYNWVAIRGTYILLYVSQEVKKFMSYGCLFVFVFCFYFIGFPLFFPKCLWYYKYPSRYFLPVPVVFFYNPPLLLLQRIKTKGSESSKEKKNY